MRWRDYVTSQLTTPQEQGDPVANTAASSTPCTKLRSGLALHEARRQAQIEFGGVEQVNEACRDARATRLVHGIAQDRRFALRLLR